MTMMPIARDPASNTGLGPTGASRDGTRTRAGGGSAIAATPAAERDSGTATPSPGSAQGRLRRSANIELSAKSSAQQTRATPLIEQTAIRRGPFRPYADQ